MLKKIIVSLVLIGCSFSYAQQSYYNDVNLNLTGLSLKQELATKIISTHTRTLSYSQIWDACKVTDVNPTNSQQVLLVYGWENGTDGDVTNDRTRGINDNSGSTGDWNREHVYPRSLGTPNLGDAGPGADAHHLRPSDVQRNSSRGNNKFASGSGSNSGSSNGGWYPGDEWKGDVARMMMYMYLRYDDRCLPTNVGIGSDANTPDNMIDLFLQWNADDPVSDLEKQRNTYHENTSNPDAQGNRNPFIDNPRLATRIWGGPDAEDIWGIYTNTDVEAPSVPSNVMASNITTFSVDVSWTAATDNVGVSSYDIYVDGNLYTSTTNTSITISNLISNTSLNVDLDNRLRPMGNPQSLNLTNDEKLALEAFLKTLTGTDVYTNEKWSNPFDQDGKVTLVGSTLSTQEDMFEKVFRMYPNPVQSNLNITLNAGNYKVHIYDIVGKQWLSKNITESDSFNIAYLTKGIYFIRVIDLDSGNKIVKRFVKQ